MYHIGKQFIVLKQLFFQTLAPKRVYASWIKYKAGFHTSLYHHIAFNRENWHGLDVVSSFYYKDFGGTQWCSWLRHCATSQKVAGLIPNGVIGFFH
jgi:hypothetical protein